MTNLAVGWPACQSGCAVSPLASCAVGGQRNPDWQPASGWSPLRVCRAAAGTEARTAGRTRRTRPLPRQNILIARLHVSQNVHTLWDGTLSNRSGKKGVRPHGSSAADADAQLSLVNPNTGGVCLVHCAINRMKKCLETAERRSTPQGCSHGGTGSSMWSSVLLARRAHLRGGSPTHADHS